MDRSYKHYLKPSSILKFSSINYLQSFLSFGASIFLARSIGKELYGDYALGLIFFNILSTVNQFGSGMTLMRDLVHEEEPKSVLKAATYINLTISIFTLSSVWIWMSFQDMGAINRATVMLLALAGTSLGVSPVAWFDYKGHIHRQAVIFASEKLFFLLSVITIVLFSNHSTAAFQAAIALLSCRLLCAVREWQFVFRNFDGLSTQTGLYIRKLLTKNIWVWVAVVGNLLMAQGNQLILKSTTDKAQLASYAVAFQLIMLIRIFQKQLIRLMAPTIAELTKRRGQQLAIVRAKMHKFHGFSVVSSLVCVLPLYIAAPLIIGTVVGQQYLDAVPIFRVLLIWISLFGVALINNQFLIGFNLNRYFWVITMSFGIISLFLAFHLIPLYQGRGAALSLLISHFGSILAQVAVVELFIYKTLKWQET